MSYTTLLEYENTQKNSGCHLCFDYSQKTHTIWNILYFRLNTLQTPSKYIQTSQIHTIWKSTTEIISRHINSTFHCIRSKYMFLWRILHHSLIALSYTGWVCTNCIDLLWEKNNDRNNWHYVSILHFWMESENLARICI